MNKPKSYFYCEKTNISFNSQDTVEMRSKYIKITLTKAGISIFDYLKAHGLDHLNKKCKFCGDYNHDIMLVEHVVESDGKIIPTGIVRKRTAPYFCYHNPKCPGRHLNRNSVEFIKTAFDLTEEEALQFLHSRSQSPFYKDNHASQEEYQRFQSRSLEWFKTNNKDRNQWINSANESRSLAGYIKKYGEDIGESKWLETCKGKAITLQHMIDRYGEIEGPIRYQYWKETTDHSIETYVKKYGKIKGTEEYLKTWLNHRKQPLDTTPADLYHNFVLRVAEVVRTHELHTYQCYSFDRSMRRHRFYQIGKEFFDKTDRDIEHNLIEMILDYKSSLRKVVRTKYSWVSWSHKGTILKSMTEIQLYDLLIKNNLEEDIDFVINKKYPESTFFYDFFFPQLNEYIEIAGRLDNLDYQKHMEFKQKQFNATILEPSMAKKYFKDIIQRVKS